MDDVLPRAADLGRAIRATERFRALREAEAEVMKDAGSVKLAQALATLQEKKAALAREGKELAAPDRASLETIAAAAAADARLQALSKAQAAFQELVDSVSRTMLEQLKP
jgi:cell fate (sporulation/competence/biofilm development) regulator YlbF (YheA/YmcA/DUF963 family)